VSANDRIAVTLFSLTVVVILFFLGHRVGYDRGMQQAQRSIEATGPVALWWESVPEQAGFTVPYR